ncbi:MAG: response regulator transcription factor [Bdellovibrionales bacterium]|nr:response regulator transcription factor [Bdellovibrionales bacterium]
MQEEQPTTSVVLVDDHAIVRHAIRTILEGSGRFKVVGEGENAAEGLDMLAQNKPEILVLDLGLPGKSGLEVLNEVHRSGIPTKVIVLTMHDDEQRIQQALGSGAKSFLLKNSSCEEFISAMDLVRGGSYYLPEQFKRFKHHLMQNGNSSQTPVHDPLSILSPRERELFFLLADGLPNRVIAKKLFISPRTVETHRARVIRKLDLKSNADLIRFAIREGLITA